MTPYRDPPSTPSRDPGVLRVRITAPVAAIVIAAMLMVGGGWLALVLTKTLPVDSGLSLLSHLGAFLFGSGVPLFNWYRQKRLEFDLGSDPPKGGPDGDARP